MRNSATGQLDPYHLNSDLWIEHLWVEITWFHSNSIINIEIQNIRCQYLLFRNTSIQTNSCRKILIQIDWTQHFLFHKNSIQNNLAPPLIDFPIKSDSEIEKHYRFEIIVDGRQSLYTHTLSYIGCSYICIYLCDVLFRLIFKVDCTCHVLKKLYGSRQ